MQDAEILDLLRDSQAGDLTAMERLLAAAYPRIGRYLRGHFGRTVEATDFVQDLTQEALLRVADGLRTCRAVSGRQFWTWARSVALHASVDAFRREAHDPAGLAHAVSLAEDASVMQTAAVVIPSLTDAPRVPEGRDRPASATEILEQVLRQTVEELPPATLALLWDRLVGGETWANIGAARATTPGAAKRRGQRALHRVRRLVLAKAARLPAPDRMIVHSYLARLGVRSSDPTTG